MGDHAFILDTGASTSTFEFDNKKLKILFYIKIILIHPTEEQPLV